MEFLPARSAAPALAFALLCIAIGLPLLRPSARAVRGSLGLCGAAILLGAGTLIHTAALPALGLAALCLGARLGVHHPRVQMLALLALAAWAVSASLHLWPGFAPLSWQADFGRHSRPLVWHFDKGLAGWLLVLALYKDLQPWRFAAHQARFMLAGAALLCALAALLGLARFEPRWPAFLPVWLAGNLFLTVVAEEALFRGLLQARLSAWLATRLRAGVVLAQAGVALLFGLAHLGWGWPFALLAVVAGFLYGRAAGHPADMRLAMLAHFGTNAILLILFDSPLG